MLDELIRQAAEILGKSEVMARHCRLPRFRQRHEALVAALVALGSAGVEGVPPVVVGEDGGIVD